MSKNKHKSDTIQYICYNGENGWADLNRPDWQGNLYEINDRLVKKHNLSDSDRHFDFLCEATEILQELSRIKLTDKIVIVPSDLTEFKKVKAKIRKAIKKIDELSELLFSLKIDATSDTLLQHFDPDDALHNYNISGTDLLRVLAQIDEFSGSAGNRPTGDWAERFCLHCQRFWFAEFGEGTRIMFESGRQTKITSWVTDVYEELRQCLGIRTPISKIQTVARHVAAYRPENDTDYR